MDDLQYPIFALLYRYAFLYSFKPCYIWMTFNTKGMIGTGLVMVGF